jgi:hypothetical protein
VPIGSDGSGDRVGRVDTVGLVGFAQSNNPINPTKNLTPKTTQTTSNQTQDYAAKNKRKNQNTAPTQTRLNIKKSIQPTQISINITSYNKHQEKKFTTNQRKRRDLDIHGEILTPTGRS